MFSAPQRQLKVAFKHGSSEAQSTELSFGCCLSLSSRGPPHRREQDRLGTRQLRRHSSPALLLCCYSRTVLADRCRPAAAQRLLEHLWWFWKLAGGRRSPLVPHEGSVGWRRSLRRGARPLRTCPRELPARGALPWAARPGTGEAEACFTPPPVLPLLGAARRHPGHLPRRLDTMAPGPTRARLHARWQHRLCRGPGRRVRVWRRRGKRPVPGRMRD